MVYTTYPAEGGLKALSVGETMLNFETGQITLPSGGSANLSKGFQLYGDGKAHSFWLYATGEVYVKTDGGDYMVCGAGQTLMVSNVEFSILSIKAAAICSVRVFASSDVSAVMDNTRGQTGVSVNKSVSSANTALSITITNTNNWHLSGLLFHWSGAATCTVTATLVDKNDSNYNTVLYTNACVALTSLARFFSDGEAEFSGNYDLTVTVGAPGAGVISYLTVFTTDS